LLARDSCHDLRRALHRWIDGLSSYSIFAEAFGAFDRNPATATKGDTQYQARPITHELQAAFFVSHHPASRSSSNVEQPPATRSQMSRGQIQLRHDNRASNPQSLGRPNVESQTPTSLHHLSAFAFYKAMTRLMHDDSRVELVCGCQCLDGEIDEA
jgi:hypothetical protein